MKNLIAYIFLTVVFITLSSFVIIGQETSNELIDSSGFQIGEKITYTVSFENYNNVAYAEIYVASSGKLGEQSAIEVRSKFKTLNFFSAAFAMIDESRTSFISLATGMPLYTVKTQYDGGRGNETTNNFLVNQSTGLDLLTAIYKLRQTPSLASINFIEDGKPYSISLTSMQNETVKTNAGQFETVSYSLQGDYLTERGWTKAKLNFSADEKRIPVKLSLMMGKQNITVSAASVSNISAKIDPIPQPTPTSIGTKPTPKPTPYINNRTLSTDLPFKLGERLTYKITVRGTQYGEATFTVPERIQINGKDSLIFNAAITGIDQQGKMFDLRDKFRTEVNPESLIPTRSDIRFFGELKGLNQTAIFDEGTNAITFGQAEKTDAPVGTHNLLSLFYAMRSFNLRPSKNATNPVNDTRVAVFWGDKATIFTLRPSQPVFIEQDGKKVDAQLINITTGNAVLDRYALKVWLSNDDERLPIRFTVGEYQADLTQNTINPPK